MALTRSPSEDLAAMARDELDRAVSLTWNDLVKVVPWGDDFEGVTPAGQEVTVERAYLWATAPGGDILCEVRVYGGPSRYDHGARAEAIIAGPQRS